MKKLLSIWNTTTTIVTLVAVVFLVLWLRSANKASDNEDRYRDNLEARNSEIISLKLSNDETAEQKRILEVSNKELKDQLWDKDDTIAALLEKLKNPVIVVKWKTRFEYKDTLYIPFDRPVEYEFERSFFKASRWYSVTGNVTQDGVTFREVSIPNTQRLVAGYRKGKPVVTVTNSNPHIITEDIEGQLVTFPRKNWVVGAGAIWNVYQAPSLGIFLGYKLFQF